MNAKTLRFSLFEVEYWAKLDEGAPGFSLPCPGIILCCIGFCRFETDIGSGVVGESLFPALPEREDVTNGGLEFFD